MFKEYINDLFCEGLGDIFFMKYYKFIKKNVHNKILFNLLIGIHVAIYLIFLMVVTYIIFKFSFPL